MLPKNFPPYTTVQHCFYWPHDSGTLDIMNETLIMSTAVRLVGQRS